MCFDRVLYNNLKEETEDNTIKEEYLKADNLVKVYGHIHELRTNGFLRHKGEILNLVYVFGGHSVEIADIEAIYEKRNDSYMLVWRKDNE